MTDSVATNPSHPLVFVASYTNHGNLAHVPSGRPAPYGMYVYRLCARTGQLVLLSMAKDFQNPAFLRYHPEKNVLYLCTESIEDEGIVAAYEVDGSTGALTALGHWGAAGTSTCYLTIDRDRKHVLAVNYWNSAVAVLPMTPSGALKESEHVHKPPKSLVAVTREDHLKNRQLEPHAHALVLDPALGRVAYVPDLGLDVVKQLIYDQQTGELTPAGQMATSDVEAVHGPRYIEFHPRLPIAYVVNEISSTVAVFEFNQKAAEQLAADPNCKVPTLKLVQTVATVPPAFPAGINTCGRICVDPSGQFVLVSNRGHNSIASFKVNSDTGHLAQADFFHTRGRTPRHFQFDGSGRWLVVANQDTDVITVFAFDHDTGSLSFTGNTYDVPSPNFVCVKTPYKVAA